MDEVMTDTPTTPKQTPKTDMRVGPVANFFRATEIDTRLLGMVGALFAIWLGFHLYGAAFKGGGAFLTPRNLWTLLVQTSSIAIMSTGMVLLIVMRQLDLSVGSMLSLVAVAGAVLQVFELVPILGVGHPAIWIIAVIFCIVLGTLVGALNGLITAYAKIPAFIVTLGGLLAYSGLAFYLAKGETVAPMDKNFKLIEILIRISGTNYKRIRRTFPGKYPALKDQLQSINKSKWICRKIAIDEQGHRDPWQWTFLLGTNWTDYRAWENEGFYFIDDPRSDFAIINNTISEGGDASASS